MQFGRFWDRIKPSLLKGIESRATENELGRVTNKFTYCIFVTVLLEIFPEEPVIATDPCAIVGYYLPHILNNFKTQRSTFVPQWYVHYH